MSLINKVKVLKSRNVTNVKSLQSSFLTFSARVSWGGLSRNIKVLKRKPLSDTAWNDDLTTKFSRYLTHCFKLSSFKLSSFKLSSFKLSSFKLSSFKLSSFKLSSFKLSSFKLSRGSDWRRGP